MDSLPEDIYCGLITTLRQKCIQHTLLEAWRFEEELVMSATQEEILSAVNGLERSPWYGYSVDYGSALGGVTRNSSGHIVAAKTAQMYWSIRWDIPLLHLLCLLLHLLHLHLHLPLPQGARRC